ncbi:MAG: hypothetical protein L0Z62_32720 [Gemmataceae bacterium]|nr:hypothetical protein [Gemmataceae bacterium]
MATIERTSDTTTRKRLVLILVGLLGLAAVVVLIISLSRPPQMGADEDVFRTVDALYTAVRSRDEKRLGQCAKRLADYRESGKLPAGAGDYLDGVIAQARGGEWESAVRRLYDFMVVQRREGASGSPEHKERPRSGKKK